MEKNSNCFGCGACECICDVGAISIEYNKKGFLEKKIDDNKCIKCYKCDEVCGLNYHKQAPNRMRKSYFFVNKDIYDRNVSSSGGFVKALADYVLDRGGVCFGAAFDEDLTIHHIEVKNKNDIYAILGSKYVQSRTDKTFINVKEAIERNKLVLYVGTPCQIAGLKHFLGDKENNNLITVDIFCHGVPSPKIWEEYLSEYFDKQNIRYIQFRDKTLGWWQFRFRIQFTHSEYASYYRPPEDPFIKSFLNDIIINDACLDCKYRTKEKYSDFYLGDAWNINKIKQNMDDNHGITTVVVNSKRAEEILKEIEGKHHVFEIKLEDGVYSRTELFEKKKSSEKRDEFWKLYDEKGIKRAISELEI